MADCKATFELYAWVTPTDAQGRPAGTAFCLHATSVQTGEVDRWQFANAKGSTSFNVERLEVVEAVPGDTGCQRRTLLAFEFLPHATTLAFRTRHADGPEEVVVDGWMRCLIGDVGRRLPENTWRARIGFHLRAGAPPLFGEMKFGTGSRRRGLIPLRELGCGPFDDIDMGGKPNGVLEHLGIEDVPRRMFRRRAWELGSVRLRFVELATVAGSADEAKAASRADAIPRRWPRLEMSARRAGKAVRLRVFPIEVREGDVMSLTQRPSMEADAARSLVAAYQATGPLSRSADWVVELSFSEPTPPRGEVPPRVEFERLGEVWNREFYEPLTRALETVVAGARASFVPKWGTMVKANLAASPDWVILFVARDQLRAGDDFSTIPSRAAGTAGLRIPSLQATYWCGKPQPKPAPVSPNCDERRRGALADEQRIPDKFLIPDRLRFTSTLSVSDVSGCPIAVEVALRGNPELASVAGFEPPNPCGPGKPAPLVEARTPSMEQPQLEGRLTFALDVAVPALKDGKNTRPQRVRIGGLELTLSPTPLAPPGKFSKPRAVSVRLLGRDLQQEVEYETSIRLRVESIAAANQDELPRERSALRADVDEARTSGFDEVFDPYALRPSDRAPALVLAGPVAASPHYLNVDERSDPSERRNRALQLTLVRDTADHAAVLAADAADPMWAVVLDREPLTIARVRFPAFVGVSTEDPNLLEVATWVSDANGGASWLVRTAPTGFELHLPTQGIGETMYWPKDTRDGELADARFAPAARFALLPSYDPQRFAEAPWNLRRLLGNPGDRAPGAGVQRMAFELLYGLTGEILTPGRPSPVRLAELVSRVGATLGALNPRERGGDGRNVDAFNAYRLRWLTLMQRFAARLAVLEPTSEASPRNLTLTGTGVNYQLRREADMHQMPAVLAGTADWPRPSFVPKPGKLAGGATWGFEMPGQLAEVWSQPLSSSGMASNLAFSALGGWGSVKASFAKDKTSVAADVAMGRAFRYAVERIGRIGNLKNVAKHVIVYERSVAPSEQFAAEQSAQPGRPIVRKLWEYVHVLQEHRAYPDEPGVDPLTRAFVRGCRCTTPIILVNPKHKQEVFDADGHATGYTIKLWDPADFAEKPDVYPKPTICLECGSNEAAEATVACRIENPERLVFYTTYDPDAGPDPNTWPPVVNVDWADVRRPQVESVSALAPDVPEADLPDAPEMEPGYEAFTYALSSDEKLVNLSDGRRGEDGEPAVLGAVLRNVTLLRARAVETGDEVLQNLPNAVPVVRQAYDDTREALRKVEEAVAVLRSAERTARERLDDAKSKVRETAIQAREKFGDAEAKLRRTGEMFNGLKPKLIAAAKKALAAPLDAFAADLGSPLAVTRQRLNAEVSEIVANVRGDVNALRDALRKHFAETTDAVEEVLETLNEWAATIRSFAAKDAWTTGPIDAAIVELNAAGEDIGKARESVAKVTAELRKVVRQWSSSVAAWQRFARPLPHPVEPLFQAAESVLRRLEGLTWTTDAAADDAAAAARRLSDRAKQELDVALKHRLAASAAVDAAFNGIVVHVTRIATAVETFASDLANEWNSKLDEAIRSFESAADAPAAIVDAFARSANAHVAAARQKIETEIEGLIDKAITQADAAIVKVLGDLRAPFNALETEATKKIEELAARLDGLGQDVARRVSDAADRLIPPSVRAKGQALYSAASDQLRTVRAFGDAPVVKALDFNRKRVAYLLDDAKREVLSTPMAAMAQRVKDGAVKELQAIRTRIPTDKLLDRVLPVKLSDFDLSTLLPSFSGLELSKLLGGVKMPAMSDDHVKVTHGFDKEAKRAWLKTAVDLAIEKPSRLFEFAGLSLTVESAALSCDVDISAGADGKVQRVAKGSVTANWVMAVGGVTLVTFEKTKLTFDDGRVKFDVSPNRVKLHGVIQFVSDLVKAVNYKGGGLTIELIQANGLPLGARASLALPLPTLGGGTSSIQNLLLTAGFELRALDDDLKPAFAIAVAFGLSRPEAPFTIVIFILGGSGYLQIAATYRPGGSKADVPPGLRVQVRLGIAACASLALSLGPISGSVYIGIGIRASVDAGGGKPAKIEIGAALLLCGEVDLAGIVTVNLTLELEVLYSRAGKSPSLVARGTITFSIKICWCFTLNIKKSISFNFGIGGDQNGNARLDEARRAGAIASADRRFFSPPQELRTTRQMSKDAARNYLNLFATIDSEA